MSVSGTAYNDAAGTPVPPPPAYGSNSVADVFESAASLLAQSSLEHPAHPLGNTSRDPLALATRLREAGADPNGFRNICVVMVDGLGEQLRVLERGKEGQRGHARDPIARPSPSVHRAFG